MSDRDDAPAPVAVPISLWSSMLMVDTVELISSFHPIKNDARKIIIEDRRTESGVLVAMAIPRIRLAMFGQQVATRQSSCEV